MQIIEASKRPRVSLGHFPTPLEPMPNLSRMLGGPSLYVKREDCSGLATGGNKTRKLEFVVADALSKQADTLITQGGVQSNHVRQTAAAAARFGLRCEVILENRIGKDDVEYCESGNVLLDRLLGAQLHVVPSGTDMRAAMEDLAQRLRAGGARPYVIAGGASTPAGSLAYADCAEEILLQARSLGIRVNHVITATGSAGTQAGLVAGFRMLKSDAAVTGIGVRAAVGAEEQVLRLARAAADLAGFEGEVESSRVRVNCDYLGAGYGMPTPAAMRAIWLAARMEGLLLDPVYTGKCMAGLIDLIRKDYFDEESAVVFLHTGGSQALYGYRSSFATAPVHESGTHCI